jgi:hypothetical protein
VVRDPVDAPVDAVGARGLLGGDALDLRVGDGLDVPAAENRGAEARRDRVVTLTLGSMGGTTGVLAPAASPCRGA